MKREWTDREVELMSDALLSTRNMIDLALLAIDNGEDVLVPTAIEEAYLKMQDLVDNYCIVDEVGDEFTIRPPKGSLSP